MNQAKLSKRLPSLIGKTISKVFYRESAPNSSLPTQMILEFDDGTQYEVYQDFEGFSFTGLLHNESSYLENLLGEANKNGDLAVLAEKESVSFTTVPN